MKKKIKISLILSLAIIFGCFSNVFAASNQNKKIKKIDEVKKSVRVLDSTNDNGIDQYTKLLMHMDDDNFKDECDNGVTNKGVKLDTTNKKIGKGSANFDGNSYFSIPESTNLDLYNKDFTLECWIKLTTKTTGQVIQCGGSAGTINSDWALYISSQNTVSFYASTGSGTEKGTEMINAKFTTVNDGLFHHYEVDRKGCNFYLFLDGNLVNTINKSDSIKSNNNQPITIGFFTAGSNNEYFQGNLDELKLSIGIARHTSNFTPYGIADGISLNKTTDSLVVDQTDTLIATVTPDNATNKTVNWASSDPTIVSVDANGKITALKSGIATITATTTDGSNLSKSCTVTVNEPTNIALDKTTDSINVGDTDKITASVTPAGQDVTWTSSDGGIVKVDQNGNITGLKAGTAIITATTADGKTVSCTVTVKDQKPSKSKLTLYMNDKTIREFYLTQDEIDNFIDWYTLKIKGEVTMQPYYAFNVSVPGKSSTKKSYVWFMKIESFEVE